MKRIYRSIGSITLGWLIGSCGGGDTIVGPPPPTTASVTISSDTATLVPAATVQLSATARTAAGDALPRTFSWTSTDPTKATVSSSGMVVGVAPGTATITAAVDGKSSTATITVLDGGVVSASGGSLTVESGAVQILVPAAALTSSTNLSVVASNTFLDPRLVKGTSFDFGPTGTNFAKPVVLKIRYDGGNVPSGTEEAALEIYFHDPSAGWQVVPGSTVDLNAKVVSAEVSHFSTYAIFIPEAVATLEVSPLSANVVVGETQQLTTLLKDANGNVLTGRTVSWSSNNTAAATVDANGLVTGVAAGGPVTITATSETKTGTSSITVSPVPVATLTLSAPTTPMIVGGTQVLTATPKDGSNNTLSGRTVNWVSSNPQVLSVSSPSSVSSSSGATITVTAAAVGTAIITATSESAPSASTPVITVDAIPVATVTVSPPSVNLVLGITPTRQLTATPKDANNNVLTGRNVTWSSSVPAVATVDANGFVTAVAGGSTTVTATSETKTGTSSITVTLAPVSTITVTPPSASVAVGGTQQLTAVTKDGNGNVLTGRVVTWSSSNNAAASVSSTGLVTGIAAGGPTTITATSETKTGTSSITVSLVPVASVTVTPPSASLVLGITPTQQLTAVTEDANGTVLTGRVVTWSSSNNGVASVDPNGLVTAHAAGGPVTVTATSETKTGTSSISVIVAPVNTVTVTPATASLVTGGTQQLTAVTKDVNGTVLIGRAVTWSSTNNAVATVDATGLVTGVGAGGPVTITATSETKTGTSSITVTPAPVNTVIVTPTTASLVVGATQLLTATPTDVNGNVLTGRTATWSSSDNTVATVDANGLVTGVAVGGPATITATSETKIGTSSITVHLVPVATVTLSAPTTPMIVGGMQVLTAAPKDASNNTLVGRTVNWVSSNTAVLIVSASSSVSTSTGATVTVTAVGQGTATVTATSETAPSATTPVITVNPAPVATVTVTPLSASLVLGITPTQQLTAVTKDANGNVLTGRTVTWSSSNNAVATVDSNGLVTAQDAGGPVTITATSETKTGTSSITVTLAPVNTVAVTPTSASIVLGVTPTQQLTATLTDLNGNVLTGRTVTWTSSNATQATVDANGLVTGVAAGGPVTITATSETKTGTSSITVTLAPVATVTVTPTSGSLVLGVTPTQQLTATLRDAANNVLTGRLVTWTSSNPGAGTVDANGLVTAVGAGGTTITATSETKTGTSSITVTLASVNTVTLSVPTTPMVMGASQVLTAVAKDANGSVLVGRLVTWVSSNSSVLTVSPASSTSGTTTVTAAGVGTATITATSESASSTPTPVITVNPVPVASVTVTPATASLVVGGRQQLTATVRDAANKVLSGRVLTWISGNPAAATVDGNGLVTGVNAGGPLTVTSTSEGVSGTSQITVAPAQASGPLRVSTVNPRYFANPAGQIVYLTGSEYWKTIEDDGISNPPPPLDFSTFLDFLQRHNHNFTRLFTWEHARWSSLTPVDHFFSPNPYVRTGPDTALDGGPKFDLAQINPVYLARVRQRVIDAGARGIYVSVQLFDGWSLEVKPHATANNPWLSHPFNAANNINGINGDPNGDQSGTEAHSLAIPAITALQETYVKAVIDAVNDLDNLIYEISNESDQSADAWQYHMIDFIRSYEATKPKQHPIGMTVPYPTVPDGTNIDVLNSTADWMSLNGDINNPSVANGFKVSLNDTDHLCGICGDPSWPWKNFTRGHNTLLMDGYDGSPGYTDPAYIPTDPVWEAIRTNMGYVRSYAVRMDLAHALPRGDLASTGYCLAVVGSEYLVFLPSGGSATVNLSGVSGSRTVEWFNPATGQPVAGGTVPGGGTVTVTAPFSGMAAVYIRP